MDTFQNLLLGFQVALSLQNITFCFIGVLIGTLLGVLPGIGPITGVAILIPITFGMNATTAIITMAGVYYGAMYGGSTASILINVPGESASVITTLDGYQMARKGRAGPALGMAALSSFIAGTFSVILLTFIAPPLVKFALAFGPPEYFALTFMGLTLVTSLSGDSMTKCLMSGVFGLLLACVGIDAVTGTARFAYGQIYLLDGFGFIGVAVGLFAVASEKFLELSRVALALRPTFSMIAGMEFLAASVPLGCAGSYSSAGAICPNLCTQLYDACVAGESALARQLQFKLARLWDLFRDQYPSSLKGGMVVMGRPVGPTRPPLPTATKERQAFIAKELAELGILETEPHGWQCFNTMRRFASAVFTPGLVHTPVTPFAPDNRIDFGLFETLIKFHLRNGSESLAIPMHAGESVSLSDEEQRALLAFTIAHVKGRVPVIAHTSDSGTAIAAARARHAEESGAAAIIATTPYYWTPPPAMIVEHFAQIGSSVRIPFFVYYAPGEGGGGRKTEYRDCAQTDRPAR